MEVILYLTIVMVILGGGATGLLFTRQRYAADRRDWATQLAKANRLLPRVEAKTNELRQTAITLAAGVATAARQAELLNGNRSDQAHQSCTGERHEYPVIDTVATAYYSAMQLVESLLLADQNCAKASKAVREADRLLAGGDCADCFYLAKWLKTAEDSTVAAICGYREITDRLPLLQTQLEVLVAQAEANAALRSARQPYAPPPSDWSMDGEDADEDRDDLEELPLTSGVELPQPAGNAALARIAAALRSAASELENMGVDSYVAQSAEAEELLAAVSELLEHESV